MNEFNNNIAGYNADGICVGCLNFNRKMFYAGEVKECLQLLCRIDIPQGRRIQVCWECLAAVQAVSRFRAQVTKSFAVLMEYSKKHRYLESMQALTKHASTRLSSQMVSITSTQWPAEPGKEMEKAGSDDETVAPDDDNAGSQTEEVKLELEDFYADPLSGFDSDTETAEPTNVPSDSEDEVIQLSRVLRSGGDNRRALPHREDTDASADTDLQNITLSNLSSKITNLFQITNQIAASQKRMMRRLAQPNSHYEPPPLDSSGMPLSPLKQITSLQELNEMEENLAEEQYKSKLVNACSLLCSKGYGNGLNCAYTFLDVLFSRAFLCQCSWCGGTRSEGEKIALKFYKRTLHFFFETVYQWDPTYTVEVNEHFIKCVLRNAKKRNESRGLRRSMIKRRPTKRRLNEGADDRAAKVANEVASKVQENG